MEDYRKYVNALRKCAKEHENDRTSTGHIIVSDLCRDTANLLEKLEREPYERGKWFDCGVSARCSICGCKDHEYSRHKYCPHCGAKMESEG